MPNGFKVEDERLFTVKNSYINFLDSHKTLNIHFAYGYLTPSLRVRIHLPWVSNELQDLEEAFLDEKKFSDGVKFKKSTKIDKILALKLYENSECTLSKYRFKWKDFSQKTLWSIDCSDKFLKPYSCEVEPLLKNVFLPEFFTLPEFVGEEILDKTFTHKTAKKYNNGPSL